MAKTSTKKAPKDAIRVQAEDFSVEEEVKKIMGSSRRTGAVVTFLGTARDFSEGRTVSAVEFEQYAGMALKALGELREGAIERFDIIDVRIVHRVSTIEPGGQIVLIVVSSEHRAEAFEACRYLIDTLKQTVPIWKKEHTPEGDSWVTPHP
jgi:molybdopterin synthase catalytic subunit